MDIRQIAAEIARELRAHPERWTLHHERCEEPFDVPRCLMGLIRKRYRKAMYRTSFPEFVAAIDFDEGILASGCDSAKIMIWNDQQKSVEAIIAVCEKVAAGSKPKRTDSELVADLMARIGKQTIPDGEIASPEYVRA